MNRAAFIGQKMALAQGGPAEPKHFSEANYVARLERFDRHSHERSSADQILFGEVNVATDTTTFRAAGLTTEAHAAIVVKSSGGYIHGSWSSNAGDRRVSRHIQLFPVTKRMT